MSAQPRFFRFLWLLSVLILLILPLGTVSAGDNNIHWNELGFNSRDPLYRSPVGAVPTGTPVRVRLKALDGDLTSAQVRVWNDRIDGESIYDMTRVVSGVTFTGDPNTYEFWEATLPGSAQSTVYWYRFIVKDGSATAYYEDDAARDQGWGQVFGGSPDNSYQLTFYDPAFQTPDWVKNAIIYQIFPDRFRDGDDTNNTPAGSFFYGNNDSIVRSNGTLWNDVVCDPRATAGAAEACLNAYSHNFYGGDLQGIIDQLDYIEGLGITAIYLNPIFESPSNHKYDGSNYYQVDDNFGVLGDSAASLALFQTLATEAHARGIRIILDGVFNHASSDSVYFDRYNRWDANGSPVDPAADDDSGACESSLSPYFDWFRYYGAAEPGGTLCPETGMRYRSWFGYDSLPVMDPFNAEVLEYFIEDNSAVDGDPIAVARYWMQWADGWRLDVGGDLDQGTLNSPANTYWENFRTAVHATNPDAYIVGEEWGNATSWTIDNQWDATMNYQYSSAFLSFFRDTDFVDNDHNGGSSAGVLAPITPTQFNNRIENWEERYAPEALYAMMNLLGSHDTNRPLFMLDHSTGGNNTALYANPSYDWSDAIQRYLGVLALQMTMPGAPTTYYGDEVGLVGPPSYDGSQWQDDPYNRQPYPWLETGFGTPYYSSVADSGVQTSIQSYYTDLTSARAAHPALRTGSYDPLLLADGQDSIAYGRKLADDSDVAIVVANGSGSSQTLVVDVSGYLPEGYVLTDIFGGGNVTVTGGQITINSLPARNVVVLVGSSFAGQRPANVTTLGGTTAANQVALTWTGVPNAASYQIFRSRLSGGGYELVGTSPTANYTDTGVNNGVQYCYVVVGVSSTGLESGWSNETCEIPAFDLTSAWFNLQWPHSINHVLNLANPTEDVYGQIWINGVTSIPGATAGIMAQVGYGPQSDAPSLPSWTWFPMTYSEDKWGANDEFKGTMTPTQVGTFNYTTRWSSDGGNTWYYTDKSGPPYDANDTGILTVTAPTDSTPPDAPTNLTALASTSTSVTLGWDLHTDDDDDLAGFEVWERVLPAGTFTKVATISDPLAVQYVRGGLTPSTTYEYYLKAFDTSTNASDPSNTIQVTAEFRMVDVTFQVTAPNNSILGAPNPGTVYIAGSFPSPYPFWDQGGIGLTHIGGNVWSVTLQILDGTVIQYKYTRGIWDTVEKGVNYEEVGNRQVTVSYGTTGTQLVTDTVPSWRDPYVVAQFPSAGAALPNTQVRVTFSQPLNLADVTTPGEFTVTGETSGAVSGVITYDAATRTLIFTPDAPLNMDENYSVQVQGKNGAADGNNQLLSHGHMFVVVTPTATEHTNPILTINDFGNHVAEGATVGDQFAFRLNTQPTADVVVTFTTSNPGQLLMVAPGSSNWSPTPTYSITFSLDGRPGTGLWNRTTLVNLTGVADSLPEGTTTEYIYITTSSADPNYNNVSVPVESVNIYDPGVNISANQITFNEASTEEYSVVLTAPPGFIAAPSRLGGLQAEVVTVTPSSSNPTNLGVSSALVFTRANWYIPQMVTLNGMVDGEYLITHGVSSSITINPYMDTAYGGIGTNVVAASIGVVVTDTDSNPGNGQPPLIIPPLGEEPILPEAPAFEAQPPVAGG
ncbi:MAG: Ig-like domain-containing protein [Anaerolinea sp.]|nr:Ig-like domain-containing protein [Anaerolinea sp.]